MVTFEFNKEKLSVVSKSLRVVAQNMNIEAHNQKASLKLLETLNLSSGDTGLMDMQMEQVRSNIKFIDTQLDLILSLHKLATK